MIKIDVEIVEIKKNIAKIKIKGETHTLCNLIRAKAYETQKIELIGYSIPHPLKNESEISLKTKNNANPIDALTETAELAIEGLKELKEKIKKQLKTQIERISNTKKGESKIFCKKCGSLLTVKKENNKKIYECPKCGNKEKINQEVKVEYKTEIKKEKREILIIDETKQMMPTVRAECPKCGNKEAYWWLTQTRSADEPETRFYRCTKCKYTWREY